MVTGAGRLSGRIGLVAGALALLLTLPATAPVRADDEQDAGSSYARVRYVEGKLTLQRTGEGEVEEGVANSPLAPGDVAWTDDGRAEIELADGSVLRLDAGTRLDLRSLADAENRYEKTNLLALEQGSLRIDAAEAQTTDKVFQIDTEGGSIYLLSGGSFRIDAEGSAVTVSSFRGVAELAGDGGSALVRSGERSSVGRGGTPADPRAFNTLRRDDFDRFCEDREAALLRPAGEPLPEGLRESLPQEVSPYAGELSVYGDWHSVPDYGWVWRPTYAGGWSPYLYGDWVWAPTGWAWVSTDPWGWAPYHYGRWSFTADLGWFWIPGAFWRGAWVSFAVGPTYVGWCPLDFYNRPVFTDVSVINVTNVNVTRLDVRGWRFVPLSRFGGVRGARTVVVRSDRLPRTTEVVVTDRLPRFDPRGIASHPDKAAHFVDTVRVSRTVPPGVAGSRPVPFRTLERERREPERAPALRGRPQPPLPESGGARQSPPALRPRGERVAPPPGAGFGGIPLVRQAPEPRGRAQRAVPPADRFDRSIDRPGPASDGRARPAATPSPVTPRPATPRQVAPQPPSPPPREREDERRRPLERLFGGVRGERPPAAVVPPPRPRPQAPPPVSRPRAESRPRRESPPPPARPRETPEHPPRRERERHH